MHHSGGMPGFRAEFARLLDDQLTIIVLMNLDDVDIDSILLGIANLYLPAPARTREQSSASAHGSTARGLKGGSHVGPRRTCVSLCAGPVASIRASVWSGAPQTDTHVRFGQETRAVRSSHASGAKRDMTHRRVFA